MNNESKRKITIIILFILYRLFLDYSYFNEIVLRFNYYGFKDCRTITSLFLSWAILFFFMLPITKIMKKEITLSSIILAVISIISITPFTTLIYANFLEKKFIIMNILYWFNIFALYFIFNKNKVKKLDFKLGNFKLDDKFALILGIFSLMLVLYISWKYTGFRINFNLDTVYELRNEARTYNFPTIIQYLFNWSRSINVLLLAYYLFKKRYLFAALFFTSQIFSFGIDGLKTTLFMTILTIILSFVFDKKKQEHAGRYILKGITYISLLGVIEKIVINGSRIIDIVIRRMMILPVYLNSRYADFFSYNKPDYFRRSIFKFFGVSSPYNSLEFTIGQIYFNKPLMRCNNGLFSEAVTNFGTLGVILEPILFIIILKLMDRCTIGLNKKIIIIVGIYFGIRLIDTFLSVGLLTHGFLITILIMMLLRNTPGSQEIN